MPDSNTPVTQALEPVEVTQADLDLEQWFLRRMGDHWKGSIAPMLARHRQSSNAASVRAESIMNAVLDLPFANTAPIEWDDADWHQVRRALAAALASLSTPTAEPTSPCPGDGMREEAAEARRVEAIALNQNDEMRQQLSHVGNMISDLARAMGVDQADADGGWPDLAGRIQKLIDAALTPSPLPATQEADEHYTVAMDRRPKEIGGVEVGPGLYRIHWKDGGSSLAAIGMCRNGAWWVAPTNWVEPAVAFRIDEDPEGRWSWAGVKALDRLDPAALAHPAQATPSAVSGDAGEDWRGTPYDLRAKGWSVAVHNDYRQHGLHYTFWLFTKDGLAVKGEGLTDAEALDAVRAQVAAIPSHQGAGE